jgi:hypothetical protein
MLTLLTVWSARFVVPLGGSEFCLLTSGAGVEDTAPSREGKKIETEDRILQ